MNKIMLIIGCVLLAALFGGCTYYRISLSMDDCQRVHPDRNLFLCMLLKGGK